MAGEKVFALRREKFELKFWKDIRWIETRKRKAAEIVLGYWESIEES